MLYKVKNVCKVKCSVLTNYINHVKKEFKLRCKEVYNRAPKCINRGNAAPHLGIIIKSNIYNIQLDVVPSSF